MNVFGLDAAVDASGCVTLSVGSQAVTGTSPAVEAGLHQRSRCVGCKTLLNKQSY